MTLNERQKNSWPMNRTDFVQYLLEAYSLYTNEGVIKGYEGEGTNERKSKTDKMIFKQRGSKGKPVYYEEDVTTFIMLDILLKDLRFTVEEIRTILEFEQSQDEASRGVCYLFGKLKEKDRRFNKGKPVDEHMYQYMKDKILEIEGRGGIRQVNWMALHRYRTGWISEISNMRILLALNEQQFKRVLRKTAENIDVKALVEENTEELKEEYGDIAADWTADEFELEEFDHYADKSAYPSRIWTFFEDTLEEQIEDELEERVIEAMKNIICEEADVFCIFPNLKIRLEDWVHAECQLFYDFYHTVLQTLEVTILAVTFGNRSAHINGWLWIQDLRDERRAVLNEYLKRNYLQLRTCSANLQKHKSGHTDTQTILSEAKASGLEICG